MVNLLYKSKEIVYLCCFLPSYVPFVYSAVESDTNIAAQRANEIYNLQTIEYNTHFYSSDYKYNLP